MPIDDTEMARKITATYNAVQIRGPTRQTAERMSGSPPSQDTMDDVARARAFWKPWRDAKAERAQHRLKQREAYKRRRLARTDRAVDQAVDDRPRTSQKSLQF